MVSWRISHPLRLNIFSRSGILCPILAPYAAIGTKLLRCTENSKLRFPNSFNLPTAARWRVLNRPAGLRHDLVPLFLCWLKLFSSFLCSRRTGQPDWCTGVAPQIVDGWIFVKITKNQFTVSGFSQMAANLFCPQNFTSLSYWKYFEIVCFKGEWFGEKRQPTEPWSRSRRLWFGGC